MTSRDEGILRAVLIDDERLARKRLADMLDAHPEVAIVGEARDLASARMLLRGGAPDVVFLDIDLPPASGLDLLPDLPAATDVVFVTAHDDFAVRAFEANAVDYLLKPIAPARLAASVGRLLKRKGLSLDTRPPGNAPSQAARLTPGDPFLVRDGRRWRRIEPLSVVAIQGEGTYTRLYLEGGESLLVLRTLNQWTELLPQSEFSRLSRSLLINVQRVERLETFSRDRAELHLVSHSAALHLGRVASRRLRQALAQST